MKNSSVVMLGVSTNGSHGSSFLTRVPAAVGWRKVIRSARQLGLNNGSAGDGCHCQEHATGGSNGGERIP